MNSRDRNAAMRYMAAENKKYPAKMMLLAREQWPAQAIPPHLVQVWRSNRYLAQVFCENGVTRISVNRAALDDFGGWQDNLSWDELMAVKRECGYGDAWAVECYPADAKIVNVANMRHLWVMPEPPVFAWGVK